MNLIGNAVKFTPLGGKINVTAKLLRSKDDLSITDASFDNIMSNTNGKKYLEIQVTDTGVGIKQDDQEKLFKLFGFLESTKDINSKGIGLGLHISKKLTNMFDGDIICRSRFSEGSNFIFIVALDNKSKFENGDNAPMQNRMLNPIQRKYQQIDLKKQLSRFPSGHINVRMSSNNLLNFNE